MQALIANMADTRDKIKALNLNKTIPVGTAEAGSLVTTELSTGADYVMVRFFFEFFIFPPGIGGYPRPHGEAARRLTPIFIQANAHAFFSGIGIDQAAAW